MAIGARDRQRVSRGRSRASVAARGRTSPRVDARGRRIEQRWIPESTKPVHGAAALRERVAQRIALDVRFVRNQQVEACGAGDVHMGKRGGGRYSGPLWREVEALFAFENSEWRTTGLGVAA